MLAGVLKAALTGCVLVMGVADADAGEKARQTPVMAREDAAAGIRDSLARADALRGARRIDEALALLRKARDAARKAGEKALLYKIHVRMGGLDLARGDSGAAMADFDAARKTARELADAGKRPALWLHEVHACYNRIGDIGMNLRGVEQAGAAYQAGLRVARRMVALEPEEAEWKMDLVRSLGKTAVIGAGPPENLDEALDILRELDKKGQLTPARRFWAERIRQALSRLKRKRGK